MSTVDEMRQRALDRSAPRSTTRESTLLYNEARRALRAGSPMAAQEIGRVAAVKAVGEARNPVKSSEVKQQLFEEKRAVKRQADIDIAQKLKEANQYTAAGFVKPTADVESQLGKRQQMFNEMVGQARTGSFDPAKSQAEAAKRGLNLAPAEWTAGLSRLPLADLGKKKEEDTASIGNMGTMGNLAANKTQSQSATGMLAANDLLKNLRKGSVLPTTTV